MFVDSLFKCLCLDDSYNDEKMQASYIVITSKLSSDLLDIARENNLKIVEIQN